jgi:hypothetical protein
MGKYRTKPVVIEAWRWTPPELAEMPAFITDAVELGMLHPNLDAHPPCVMIDTLEGRMRGDVGDWIIKGIKGELYPCRDDIFRMTYEEV